VHFYHSSFEECLCYSLYHCLKEDLHLIHEGRMTGGCLMLMGRDGGTGLILYLRIHAALKMTLEMRLMGLVGRDLVRGEEGRGGWSEAVVLEIICPGFGFWEGARNY
jgi:hypothetical protein